MGASNDDFRGSDKRSGDATPLSLETLEDLESMSLPLLPPDPAGLLLGGGRAPLVSGGPCITIVRPFVLTLVSSSSDFSSSSKMSLLTNIHTALNQKRSPQNICFSLLVILDPY